MKTWDKKDKLIDHLLHSVVLELSELAIQVKLNTTSFSGRGSQSVLGLKELLAPSV